MLTPTEIRCYNFGQFHLDVVDKHLFKNNELIPLTQKSIEILIFLVKNRNKTLGKTEFFNNVWAESYVDESNLTQHIYRIRKALEGSESNETFIETVPKYGYRFTAEVEEILTQSETNISEDLPNELISNPDVSTSKKIVKTDSDVNEKTNVIGSESKLLHTLPSHKSRGNIDQKKPSQEKIKKQAKGTFFLNKKFIFAMFLGVLATLIVTQFYSYFFSELVSLPNNYPAVAVFPFKHIGPDRDEKLELGVADTLISKLGTLETISVIPTESIVSYTKNDFQQNNHNLYELGSKLGADIILTGTIQREANTVRFSVRYYSIKQKRQLCTVKYDEEFSDIFTLQDSISEKAMEKLSLEIKEHLNNPMHIANSDL